MFDAAIIGTGPAGISAAINLKLHEKKLIWFGSKEYSNKVKISEKIANYPGLGLISGLKLNELFDSHIQEIGLTIDDKMVTQIMPMKDYFILLAENEMFQAKTILLATGVVTNKSFKGEKEFLGKGVSYCATCDGFLYKGKSIAIYCESKRYEHEVDYLAGLAEKVYLYTPYKNCDINLENVEKISPIQEINGDKKVSSISLVNGTQYQIDGFFCLRNALAYTTLVPGLSAEGAHITVNRNQETNLAGCFAAGDCTGRPYQLAKAIGEGNVAAHAIIEYLSTKEKQ